MYPSSKDDGDITDLNALLELLEGLDLCQDEKTGPGSQTLIPQFWPRKAGESPLRSKFVRSSNAHCPNQENNGTTMAR
jgi:hypothetical protein